MNSQLINDPMFSWLAAREPREMLATGSERPAMVRRRDIRFSQISENGFGDGQNAYAHSMAWFKGHLYVGTTRNNLCLVRSNAQRDTLRRWPVWTPKDLYESLDMRAQIWRYDPDTKEWEQVYVAPMIMGSAGREVPRDIGYRKMVVFQAEHESEPALYVSSMSWTETYGAHFLRTTDGVTFNTVSEAGLTDSSASSFRSIIEFKGKLYSSPAGQGTAFYKAREPHVVESADPASGVWKPVSIPGFGDSENTGIADFAVFNGYLYAGTVNPARGFQVWKTDAEGEAPYTWKLVSSLGAYRGSLNEGVLSFCVFEDALYVGSHISMGGHDRRNHVGPGASELIRLYADDSWDLVIGTPRQTPEGYKIPLGDMGPGFDNPFNGYFWCMEKHNGWLYVGTFNSCVFMRYADLMRQPRKIRFMLRRVGIESIVQREGGFDFWRSRDGIHWEAVTQNGFDNPYNYGIRNLVSTPHGLFVGTANPFGPSVAREEFGRYKYVDNPHGGLEIWHGEDIHTNGSIPGSRQIPGSSPRMTDTAASKSVSHPRPDRGQPVIPGLTGDSHPRLDRGQSTSPRIKSEDDEPVNQSTSPRIKSEDDEPVNQSTSQPVNQTEHEDLNSRYDQVMFSRLMDEYYEDSGFANWGFWFANTASQKEACENLMEQLLNMIPEKTGRILDVACGMGATTRHLQNYYKPENITAINVSEKQLERATQLAAGSKFMKMDATNLEFEDDTFDAIISVEAAFHFKTREAFLKEAFRVLKPGGYLVLSDILFTYRSQVIGPTLHEENWIPDPDLYEERLEEIGFKEPRVVDATKECWDRHRFYRNRYVYRKFLEGDIDRKTLKIIAFREIGRKLSVTHYLLAGGRKPG